MPWPLCHGSFFFPTRSIWNLSCMFPLIQLNRTDWNRNIISKQHVALLNKSEFLFFLASLWQALFSVSWYFVLFSHMLSFTYCHVCVNYCGAVGLWELWLAACPKHKNWHHVRSLACQYWRASNLFSFTEGVMTLSVPITILKVTLPLVSATPSSLSYFQLDIFGKLCKHRLPFLCKGGHEEGVL